MRKAIIFILLINGLISCRVNTPITEKKDFLRGANTAYRNFWDVEHYSISVEPNEANKYIRGTVLMAIKLKKERGDLLQIDLQEPMTISQIEQKETQGNTYSFINPRFYFRKGNHYFISVKALKNDTHLTLKINFEGHPHEAKKAPWDGGWVFAKDAKNRNWMSVAVQGIGASAWFPCKDYQGDEPDNGAVVSITTSQNNVGVANGRLVTDSLLNNHRHLFVWQVKNPINAYNIVPSIGHYVHFKDRFEGEEGSLSLDYWVLDYQLEKAKKQFAQVPKMLEAFEYWMGAYPFYEDGYKLVETPFLGMEHQSNIAYGNGYTNGYLGKDRSGSGWGNLFDFIIIHESGHEWFGNNITTEQVADMWVHEAFTTYTESLFVDYFHGKKAGAEYVIGQRDLILNDKPIQGVYNVHQEGSVDMYYKGANMLHTLRTWLNNDDKFRAILRGLNRDFRHKIVTGKEVEQYMALKSGLDLSAFFNQYVRTSKIPLLEIKKAGDSVAFRYQNVVKGFAMPLRLKNNEVIYPTDEWQKIAQDKFAMPLKDYLVEYKE